MNNFYLIINYDFALDYSRLNYSRDILLYVFKRLIPSCLNFFYFNY